MTIATLLQDIGEDDRLSLRRPEYRSCLRDVFLRILIDARIELLFVLGSGRGLHHNRAQAFQQSLPRVISLYSTCFHIP